MNNSSMRSLRRRRLCIYIRITYKNCGPQLRGGGGGGGVAMVYLEEAKLSIGVKLIQIDASETMDVRSAN